MNALQTKIIAVIIILMLVFGLLALYLSIRGGLI
jgi:hypothetical protein